MSVTFSDTSLPGVDAEPLPRSLLRYCGPRHWPAWILVGWLRLSVMLPWRVAVELHKGVGAAFWLLMRKRRRSVERKIALCFPERSHAEIRALTRRHFQNLGACLAETAFAWFGKVDDSLTQFHVEGDEHVYSALAAGHGVILYTGHFTAIEICGPMLKKIFPLVGYMFNRRRNAVLDAIQRRGRQFSGHISLPNDNVRAMIQALKQKAVVWYAPDQTYSSKGSMRLPFFGHPVDFCTATRRIARAGDAAIIPFFYQRLPDDSGYLLRFGPPIEDLADDDDAACNRRLIAVLESFISTCPEQYGWMSSRLSREPAGKLDEADVPEDARRPAYRASR